MVLYLSTQFFTFHDFNLICFVTLYGSSSDISFPYMVFYLICFVTLFGSLPDISLPYMIVYFTLYSSMMAVSTFRQVSTPSSSRGRWRGKSIRENRVWSGRANRRGAWRSFGKTCTCQGNTVCRIYYITSKIVVY